MRGGRRVNERQNEFLTCVVETGVLHFRFQEAQDEEQREERRKKTLISRKDYERNLGSAMALQTDINYYYYDVDQCVQQMHF